MAAVKPAAEADTKAETPAAKAEATAAKVEATAASTEDTAPSIKPPQSTERDMIQQAEIAALREQLALANSRLVAQDRELAIRMRAPAPVEGAKSNGATLPRALVNVLGAGRVEKKRGDILLQEELLGLTEGVHFEHR